MGTGLYDRARSAIMVGVSVPVAVPAPSALALVVVGALCMLLVARRQGRYSA